MNKISDRGQPSPIIPVTPNLEQYKLHGKHKTKKKNLYPSIQPTLQPIQTNLMQGCEKYPTTPTNGNIGNNNRCYIHPDRKGIYATENNRKYFCQLCALTDGGGDSKFMDEQRLQKTKSIEMFKKRISILKQTVNNREQEMLAFLENEQDRYGEYFSYLSNSFKNIIEDIEQKHHELNSTLIDSITKQKQSISESLQIMTNIKQSVERYIYDINYNYEEILADLSIDHFRDIMKQYNTKIQYYNENVLRKINKQEMDNINVYLPLQQIRRIIDKANIQYFGESKIGSTRSLEKLVIHGQKQSAFNQNTQKNDKYYRNERNDRKSESKIQARKRNNTHNNMVHQIRGANKQNNFIDSYYNCQSNDHRSYQD